MFLISGLHLILHVLLEDELHLFGLLRNMLVREASLEEVASLLFVVSSAILDFHVHIDGPNVHALRVVSDDTFKHGSAVLWLAVLEFEHAKLGDQVYMLLLGQRLQGSLEHCLRLAYLQA